MAGILAILELGFIEPNMAGILRILELGFVGLKIK
jgi:hypothetical protein